MDQYPQNNGTNFLDLPSDIVTVISSFLPLDVLFLLGLASPSFGNWFKANNRQLHLANYKDQRPNEDLRALRLTANDLAFSFAAHRRLIRTALSSSAAERILHEYTSPKGLISLSVDSVPRDALRQVLRSNAATLRFLSLNGTNSFEALLPQLDSQILTQEDSIEDICQCLSSSLTHLSLKSVPTNSVRAVAAQVSRLLNLSSLDVPSALAQHLTDFFQTSKKLKTLIVRGQLIAFNWSLCSRSVESFQFPALASNVTLSFFSTPRSSWSSISLETMIQAAIPPRVTPQSFLARSNVCASRWATQHGNQYLAAEFLRAGFDRGDAHSTLTQSLVRNEAQLVSAVVSAGLLDDLDSNQVATSVYSIIASNESHNSTVARELLETIKPKLLSHPHPRHVLRDSLGRSALMHMSACSDRVGMDIFRWLLEHRTTLQIGINDQDDCGNTALHHLLFHAGITGSILAVYSGLSCIKLKLAALLDAGADVSAINKRGESPSAVATRYGFHEFLFSKKFKIERARDFDIVFPGELLFRAAIEKFDGLIRMLFNASKYESWIDLRASIPADAGRKSLRWSKLIEDDPELVGMTLIQVASRYSDSECFNQILQFYVKREYLDSAFQLPFFSSLSTSPLILCCKATAASSVVEFTTTYLLGGDNLMKLLLLFHAIVVSYDCNQNRFRSTKGLDIACESILATGLSQAESSLPRGSKLKIKLPGRDYQKCMGLHWALTAYQKTRLSEIFPLTTAFFSRILPAAE